MGITRRELVVGAAGLALAGAGGCGRKGGGGNVLRYALQSPPTQLDPAIVEDGDTIDMLQNVFEGLVKWDEKNEVVPNIAEKIDLSPDGRTYTFHLKDNVRFHNGRKLVAEDFVYSFTRVLANKTSPTAMTYMNDLLGAEDLNKGRVNTLAAVKAVDDRTLQVTIDKRRSYFLAKLTYPTGYVVCKEAIEKTGGRVNEGSMVGTGPFALEAYQAGYKIKLRANRDYHGDKPVLDGIERPIINDTNSRQTAFEGGGTDFTDVQRGDLDRIRKDTTLSSELKEFPRAQIYYVALNQMAFPPFRDKRVRQAFAHAVNKDAIIQIALKGIGQKANGIIPPGVPGCDPNVPGLEFDPAKSKQLLAQAGFPDGKNFPPLTLSFRQGWQHIGDGAQLIRNDLQQNLGITVTLQQIEWGQFLVQRFNGTMPCYHLRWAGDYPDPQNFLSLMLRTGAIENKVGYSNPQFDSLCDQADVESNPEKRASLYRQAERIAIDDAPWVCLYFFREVELHKPYIRNMRDCLLGHLPHVTTTVARTG